MQSSTVHLASDPSIDRTESRKRPKKYIDDLTSDERVLAQRIAAGEDKNGQLKEQLAESFVRRNGYTILNGKYGSNNGFDLLAKAPDGSFLAIEAKPTRGNNTIQLDRSGKDRNITQMDNTWMSRTSEKISLSEPLKEEVKNSVLNNKISRAVFSVEPSTGRATIIPLRFSKE